MFYVKLNYFKVLTKLGNVFKKIRGILFIFSYVTQMWVISSHISSLRIPCPGIFSTQMYVVGYNNVHKRNSHTKDKD